MMANGARSWGARFRLAAVAGCVSLLVVTGCEPPGKPKQEPARAEDITNFATLYGENCAGCHGLDGKNGPARPLNDALYLAVIPKQALQETIENGRPGTAMPAWARSQGGPLTDRQITALVNGIEQNWAKPASFRGATLPSYSASGNAGDAGRGKKLFASDCYLCHGQPSIGSVTNATFLQLVSDQVLRTSIIEGRPDLGMPDYRNLNQGHALSDQDITDLVAYLTSIRPVEPNVESARTNESGAGESGSQTKGNEGSGNGPGSPRQQQNEGNKGKGSSSQRGVK